MTLLLSLLLLLVSCRQERSTLPDIIPLPLEMIAGRGHFVIDAHTRIIYDNPDPALRIMGEELASIIETGSDFRPEVVPQSLVQAYANDIFLSADLQDESLGDEGYLLHINPKRMISIQANHAGGVFYGLQSLLQHFPATLFASESKASSWKLPATSIRDVPRFTYRGMHLDVARHFFPVEFIKQYIDLLAFYKFNHFHWHLTEDQGWRIEIKQYPQLTETAAWRKETIIGHQSERPKRFDGIPYGGYYTQDEVREIVRYAALRNITIIPEIEMPGHAQAALAAYPYLGCTGGPYEVATQWGVFEEVFCTRESTFEFLENVLTEVMELFPGTYIHIGGDEVPKTRWNACDDCRQRMQDENLGGADELQSYFVQRIEQFLHANDRKLIGWDEILEGGLAPRATVMSWRGTEGGIAAARMGHDVIMTPNSHCYFDHYQAVPEGEPLAIGGLTMLEDVYHYEPVPEVLSPDEASHILGAQANVWTEYLKTPSAVEYMILPRMAALSEVVWSDSSQRNYEDFKVRLSWHFELYENKQLNFRPDKP